MNLKRSLAGLLLVTLTAGCAGPEAEDPGEVSQPEETVAEETPDSSGTVSQFATYFEVCFPYACPAGSQPVPGTDVCSPFCSGYNRQTGRCTYLYNAGYCMYPASGTISASPTDVWINTNATSVGTTQICWDVNHASNGEVWLSMDGQPEKLFTRSPSGCADAGWIQVGHSYSFNLYEGTAHSNQLASVTVNGYGYQGVSGASATACGPCNTGYACRCGMDFCYPINRPCP